jgi:hypothetical protein
MATNADTVTTIAKLRSRRDNFRRTTLVVTACCALFLAIATARLCVVVAATPTGVWLNEFSPYLSQKYAAGPSTQQWAARASQHLSDASLIRSLYAPCDDDLDRGDLTQCLDEIHAALQAAPSSGELWLAAAEKFLEAGDFNKAKTALTNSYHASPNEGWLAAQRVVFGLRLYPALDPELKQSVSSDLQLVLQNSKLSEPLVTEYKTSPLLRTGAAEPLRLLPATSAMRFVQMVRSSIGRSQKN